MRTATPLMAEDEVLTLNEAAAVLRIGRSKAREMAKAGTLPGILPKLGCQWRVSKRHLMSWINSPARPVDSE